MLPPTGHAARRWQAAGPATSLPPGRRAVSALVGFVRPELATEDRGGVGHLVAGGLADDVELVEAAGRLLVAAHDQDFLEALVVRVPIQRRPIAHAVELEPLERLDDLRGIEGAGTLHCVGIEDRL